MFDSNMTPKAQISNDDIILVLNSWSLVRQNLEATGIAIFLKMFEQYPHYHSLFKKFNHVPMEDLPNNKVFVRHALTVAETLDGALIYLGNLGNLDEAKNALKMIGKIHSNMNMNSSHFTHCNEAILTVLKENLKEQFSEVVETAWNKLLPVIASLIVQGMISNE